MKNSESERPPAEAATTRVLTEAGLSDDGFDWSPNNGDVIMPEQRTTAVYVNRWGQVIIRQQRAWDEDSDPYMAFDHAHLPALIAALRAIADQPLQRDEPDAGRGVA